MTTPTRNVVHSETAEMKPPPPPILFRIIGKAGDGMTVTLGKYHSLAEAEQDHARLTSQAYYREIAIHEVVPPAPPATAQP